MFSFFSFHLISFLHENRLIWWPCIMFSRWGERKGHRKSAIRCLIAIPLFVADKKDKGLVSGGCGQLCYFYNKEIYIEKIIVFPKWQSLRKCDPKHVQKTDSFNFIYASVWVCFILSLKKFSPNFTLNLKSVIQIGLFSIKVGISAQFPLNSSSNTEVKVSYTVKYSLGFKIMVGSSFPKVNILGNEFYEYAFHIVKEFNRNLYL